MKLDYFMMKTCPYCREATSWLEELSAEEPRYGEIEIRFIDEVLEAELAESFDYYYVPTFFLGEEKLHEGEATKEKIKAVLDRALAKI